MDDDLLREAKRKAAERGETLTTFIEEAVRERLAPKATRTKRKRIILPVGDGRLRPDINFSSNAAVQDLLDQEDLERGRWRQF